MISDDREKMSYHVALAWKNAVGGIDLSRGSWTSSRIPLKLLTYSFTVAVTVLKASRGMDDELEQKTTDKMMLRH